VQWIGLTQDRNRCRACGHGNELSGSMEVREVLERYATARVRNLDCDTSIRIGT
jgi:hypothetical protein